MGKSTNRTLNELLVKLFNNVMDTEERAVITKEFEDITNNDMHIIEAIGIEEPRRMSDIAKRLDVTMGTLTTNMNSLEDKGYIVRERSKTDKRVVLVVLTPKGKRHFIIIVIFIKIMIKAIVKDLDEPLKDKDVVVVEDIVDSGRTLSYLWKCCGTEGPKA